MSRILPHYASGKTAFFCCDLQTAFAANISNFANCVFVANRFAQLHEVLGQHSKYIVTEQYPKGLGHTVPEVKIPANSLVASKTRFSMVIPEVAEVLNDVESVVVFGIESHVCVMQTVAELLDMKKRVVVAIDGVGSQTNTDREAALQLMRTWGPACLLSTSESIILQMGRDAKDPHFKSLSNLLKQRHPIPL